MTVSATIKDGKIFVKAPYALNARLQGKHARLLRNGSWMLSGSPNNVLFLSRLEAIWTDAASSAYAAKQLAELDRYQKALDFFKPVVDGELDYFGVYSPKVPLYKHQRTCVNLMILLFHMGLFMDCGTGKTGTTLVYIELLQKILGRPVKALVVGKLMTLFSGWQEDCAKFTDLTCDVLWGPSKASTEVLTDEIVTDPEEWRIVFPDRQGSRGYIEIPALKGQKKKAKSAIIYIDKKSKTAITFAKRKDYNPKKHARYKYTWSEIVDESDYRTHVVALSLHRTTYATTNVKHNDIEDRILNSTANVHIINHDGARIFEDTLRQAEYDVVIIDESTVIKNYRAKLFKAMLALANKAQYKFILTGTPASNGPENLWSQLYWLDLGVTLGDSYTGFLERHFIKETQVYGNPKSPTSKTIIKYTPDSGTLDWMRDRLQGKHYRVALRDCADLPPISSQILDVFMTPYQSKAYWEMAQKLFTEIKGTTIEASIALTKLLKLRQITGGFVKSGEDVIAIDQNPKMAVLQDKVDDLLEQGEQIVIFAIFQAEIQAIKTLYPDAVIIAGGVGDAKKFAAVDEFKSGDARIVICQPQSAAHGLTFVNARYLIFYSIDYSAEMNYQAIKRIERIGQKRHMHIYYLLTRHVQRSYDCIDQTIYKVVQEKQDNQAFLIDGLAKDKENAKHIIDSFMNQMKEIINTPGELQKLLV